MVRLLADGLEDCLDALFGRDVALYAVADERTDESRERRSASRRRHSPPPSFITAQYAPDELPLLLPKTFLNLLERLESPSNSENGCSIRDEGDGHVPSEAAASSGDDDSEGGDVEEGGEGVLREGHGGLKG